MPVPLSESARMTLESQVKLAARLTVTVRCEGSSDQKLQTASRKKILPGSERGIPVNGFFAFR